MANTRDSVKAYRRIPFALVGLLVVLTVAAAVVGFVESPAHTINGPPSPSGDTWWVIVGDAIVFVALVVTLVIFLMQRRSSENLEIDSTMSALRGVLHGMGEWGDFHFKGGWEGDKAVWRADLDYRKVMGTLDEDPPGFKVPQNFRVPKEPLVALIEHSEHLALLDVTTLKIANEALRRVEVFNQMVQLQTDFNALHFHEVLDKDLRSYQRENIARSSERIALWIHRSIDDAAWYALLMKEMEYNLAQLPKRKREHWWSRRPKPTDQ